LGVDDALRAINLGDSGFLLCRLLPDEKDGGVPRWHVVHETPNQCHYFNCPYQLGFGANGDKVQVFAGTMKWSRLTMFLCVSVA
jgi:hypothetical protein